MQKVTRNMKVWAMALLATAGAVGLTACSGGGGGGYYSPIIGQNWYDVYGYYCGSGSPSPGCNYYSNGDKVIDIEDPYFYSSYTLEFGTWYYVDTFGYYQSYYGWGWQSPTGVLYDDWGRALNNSEDDSRDVVADVAAEENANVQGAGEAYAAKYELDADVGVRVARVLNDWNKIGKDRSRTDKDIADFSKRLYGIDLNQVSVALNDAAKGDKAAAEDMIAQAAGNWSTNPDTMKRILKDFYGKYLPKGADF